MIIQLSSVPVYWSAESTVQIRNKKRYKHKEHMRMFGWPCIVV